MPDQNANPPSAPRLFAAFPAEPGVDLGWASLASADSNLNFPGLAELAGATPARRREFAAGRCAARLALSRAALPDGPLPVGPDRAPIWPDGVVGSISHTVDVAAAAVARRQNYRALGLDIETIARVSLDLAPALASPSERTWISSLPDPRLGLALVFSAKEAWHKAQHRATRQVFEFQDVAATFDLDQNEFHVAPVSVDAPTLYGRIGWDDVYVLCLALWTA